MSDATSATRTEPLSAAGWLEAAEVIAVYDAAASRLSVRLASGAGHSDVRATEAFPITAPGRYVDLCDAKGGAIGMLRSLEGLEAGSRAAIEAALAARCLIPKVGRILELEEIGPAVIRWRVATDRGERTFHTESPREAIRYQTPDRIRVTDLAGNLYDFPSLSGLDAASRGLLGTLL